MSATIQHAEVVDNHHHQTNGIEAESDATPRVELDQDQLRAALLKQLEYYFSKENLEKDEYLKSQMNTEFYVPVTTIAQFKLVRALTEDQDLILEVLKNSKEVYVHESGEYVRPNIKHQRTTLILRDIRSDTPQEEVEAIFRNEGCAPVKSIKPEIGNTWFVSFETEEEALQTLEVVRRLKFKDEPIQARVKSEHPLKSLLATQSYEQYYPNHYSQSWSNSYDYGYQGNSGAPPGSKSVRGINGRGRGGRSGRSEGRSEHREFRDYQGHYSGRPHRDSRPERSEPRGEAPKTEYKGEGEAFHEASRGEQADQKAERASRSDEEDRGKPRSAPRPTTKREDQHSGPNSTGAPRVGQNPKLEGAQSSKSKPRNPVPLGPDSFPPLPGAPTTKSQEANSPLNYSVVVQNADKPVTNFVNPRKQTIQAESGASTRQSSDDQTGSGEEQPTHDAKARAQKTPKSQPPAREKAAESEEKSSSAPQEAPSTESAQAAETQRSETKDEEAPKTSSASMSYAAILRTKAAATQQAAKTATEHDEETPAHEERKPQSDSAQKGRSTAQRPSSSPSQAGNKPKNPSGSSYHDRPPRQDRQDRGDRPDRGGDRHGDRHERSERGGKGRSSQAPSHRASERAPERDTERRNPPHREREAQPEKEVKNPEPEVQVQAAAVKSESPVDPSSPPPSTSPAPSSPPAEAAATSPTQPESD